jgi:drug/metabolite transporter (DMT)-like permease
MPTWPDVSAFLALLAAITYGAADFLGGLAGRRMPTLAVVLWSQTVGLILGVVAAVLFPAGDITPVDLWWGAAGGIAGTVGIFALYEGLAVGRMSVVSPVAALLTALVPLALGLGLGERPGPIEWIGIVLAFPAIWLVASSTHEVVDAKGGTKYGLVAGLGFGLFFAAISQAGDGAGLWPLVAARSASVAVVAIVALLRRVPAPQQGTRTLIAVVGIGDILANVFLLLAFRSGLLTLVAVLASLYPAITVLLAVWVLSEPIGRRQRLGLLVALVSIALIAA